MTLMEQTKAFIEILSRAVEVAAAVLIAIAGLEATIKAVLLFLRRNSPPEAKTEVRLTLGRWLAVGLEFLLAADILKTAIAPSWNEIGQLAAIAALRTALNYFLGKEIEKEASAGRQRAEDRLSFNRNSLPMTEPVVHTRAKSLMKPVFACGLAASTRCG
jgi:uncharacterized membrane protein